ncbi:NADP-dependent oxidoreductase [Leifsonia sp. 22587]|uniref:NADP-dependent oxidoreductase n=1 Tax=Leifsonia sp. 22587 TaxID=3453946 RepID=UPI003F8738AE
MLVRVHAAGVNPIDWKTRAGGGVAGLLGASPHVLGWDVSGVVEEVGFGVSDLAPGDEVFGMPWFPRPAGAYAEYVTAPSRHFVRKLASVTHVEAAAVPLSALTAWQALHDLAGISPASRVLIHGAAGGVGHLAVQIAKHLGARVTATAREEHHSWLAGLGADELIDYTRAPFENLTQDNDAILDLIGEQDDTTRRSLATVAPGGLVMVFADAPAAETTAAFAAANIRLAHIIVQPDSRSLHEIARLLDAGRLTVTVTRTYPYGEVARAHVDREAVHPGGKAVLTFPLD